MASDYFENALSLVDDKFMEGFLGSFIINFQNMKCVVGEIRHVSFTAQYNVKFLFMTPIKLLQKNILILKTAEIREKWLMFGCAVDDGEFEKDSYKNNLKLSGMI